MGDGSASASKVVGSIDFKRPPIIHLNEEALKDRLQVISGLYCSMPYTVKVGASPDDVPKLKALVLDILHEAEMTFSLWNPESEVVAINNLDKDTWKDISPAMSAVLKVVAIMYKMSRGLFDPAVHPLLKYWKQQIESTPGTVQIKADDPTAAAIAEYSKWTSFTLSPDGTRLCKSHGQAGLDLGGVAKGWALDEMANRITAAGFENCYVDWAGDIKVMGLHPTGRRWTLDVVEPPSMSHLQLPTPPSDIPKQYLASLPLRGGMGCSTSGDYMQVKMHAGDCMYHHIFHPLKHELLKVSSTSLAQATVVAQNCMVADILSTVALVIGDPAEARKLLDCFVSYSLPVDDFLLYARTGPRIIRRRIRGMEAPAAKEERLSHHYPAEVIVVGGGLAGFCAAIEAARVGASVTLLEKEKTIGGNSAKATSGINGWGTRAQAWAGVHDEERYFERDTFRSGVGGTSDPSLVRVLSTQSAEAVHWLMDETGINLSELSQLGGHSRKRTHRAPASGEGGALPVGWYIMQGVQNLVKAQLSDKVTVKTGCRVIRLIEEQKEGRPGSSPCKTVTGLVYKEDGKDEEIKMFADAIVLATGGWGCDLSRDSLLQQFRPDIAGMPSTNGAFATGDGVKIARDIGALTIDMDKVQLHPTAFIDPKDPTNPTKVLGPEALRGCGGILINQKGERFCNELDLRSKVSNAILENCEPFTLPSGEKSTRYAWCVLNEEAQKKFGLSSIRFYKDQRGLFETAKDFETLARDVIKCDPQVLINAIHKYQEACNQQIDSQTKKNVFPARFSPDDKNLIAARVTPSIHYCMGGLRISPHGQVMEEANIHMGLYHKTRPIRRLFAAGEVTGGVHGENRLGGNSLLECVVFGRVAGERAGTIKQREPYGLKQQEWVPVRFREVLLSDKIYGINTRVFRFSFDGALQKSGLDVGQFVGIRGDLDGEIVQGFYSPISRPTEEGYIEILCRTDTKGGQIINLLNVLRPGAECYLKAMGGLRLTFQDHRLFNQLSSGPRRIRQVVLLAGGTGIAPMAQILRAYLYHQGYGGIEEADIKEGDKEVPKGVRLCYAAECEYDLAFVAKITKIRSLYPQLFDFYIVLNNPPLGWAEGVGFIDEDTIKKYLFYPPRDDQLTVICGPPIFEQKMCELLKSLGYPRYTYYAYSQPIDG